MPPLDNVRNWPEFGCRRVVRAAPIVNIAEYAGAGTCRILFVIPFEDGKVEPFVCSDETMTDKAAIGWYAVVYATGMKAAMPKDAFEADYIKKT